MAVRTERFFILRDLFSSILITESEFQQTEIQTIYVIRSMFILVDITSSTLEHLCFSMLQTLFGNNCQTLLLQILLLLHFASLWARVWETKYTLPPGTGPNVGGKFQQGFPFPWQITAPDLVVLCQIVHPQCFWHHWCDRKGVMSVKNLAPAIPKGSWTFNKEEGSVVVTVHLLASACVR